MNADPQCPAPARALCTFGALTLLALASTPAAAQHFNFRAYTSLDGLPQRQVLALLQDSAGYVWLGTYGGLTRYDGQRMVTFTTGDGLTANVVRDLAEDAAGRLVVATGGGGVCVRQEAGFECFASRDHVVDGEVLDLEPDRRGGLWIATVAGLTHWTSHWKAGAVRHFTVRDGLPSAVCNRVVEDDAGTVWAGTEAGLARLVSDGDRRGRFEPVAAARLGGRPVQMLLATPDGLWVGADSELFRWRSGRLEPIPLPGGFAPSHFTDGARDASGALWLTTPQGVLHYRDGRFRRLTEANGLLNDANHRVLVDREGTIWFGALSGLSKLAPGPFTVFTVKDGLPHSFVRAISEDERGRLWVGTRGGGVAILEPEPSVPGVAAGARDATAGFGGGSRFTLLGPAEGLPSDQVYALLSAGDGRMLVGTSHGLAVAVDGDVRRVYGESDGLPSEGVRSLLADPSGGLWVGTAGGLAYLSGGRITAYPDLPVLSDANIITLELDDRDRLWLGLAVGGVAVFDGREVTRLGRAEGFTDQTVWSLDRDREGRLWIGTNGDGALRMSADGEVERFTTADGLVDDFVWQVRCDSAGQVWLYTSRGLDRFDGRGFVHYGEGDGLSDLEGSANAAWEDSRGVLWFGNASGLVRHDRRQEVSNPIPPRVVVAEATSAPGRRMRPGERLAPGSGPLSFRFASLSFRDERSVRYRYRLLGLSETWSEPSAQADIAFGNLGPRAYELQVVGSNDDGVWSPEPATFAFTVAPAFWQTWWFRVLALAVAALAVVVVVVLRTRSLQATRRRLEALVAERTTELEEKNAQLAEMARVDELTQLRNRRCFFEVLNLELRQLTREGSGSAVSLLLLDLDHFKEVNDRHGHLVGDRVLGTVAKRLEATVRATDSVARYGGEEFAVILRSTSVEGARVIGDRVRAAISERAFAAGEVAIWCTASVGVSEIRGVSRFDEALAERLVSEADSALYRAKAAGRDRLVVHGDGEVSGPGSSVPMTGPRAVARS